MWTALPPLQPNHPESDRLPALAERQAGRFRLKIDTITSWVADPP